MKSIEQWTRDIETLKVDMLNAAYNVKDEEEVKRGFFDRHFINLLFLSLLIVFISVCIFFDWGLMLRICIVLLVLTLLQWVIGGLVRLWKKIKAWRGLISFMKNGRR